MYKKVFIFLFFVCSVGAENKKIDFESKIAAFFPKSKKFRNVYANSIPSYQLEESLLFKNQYKWWNNFSYLTKKGHSDPLKIDTSLKIFSLSSGIKFDFFKLAFNKAMFNLGAGAVYSWLEEKNEADFAKRIKRKNALGGIIKLELSKLSDYFFLSFFYDYKILSFKAGSSLEDINTNISGFYLGAAIGFRY